MDEMSDRPQQYCQHCGTRARTDNAFCVSCGETLVSASTTRVGNNHKAASGKSNVQGSVQKYTDGQDIIPYILAAAFVMIAAYLMIGYSMVWGISFIILGLLAVAMVRRTRGSQTDFEKHVFEKLPEYREHIQKASGRATSQYREWDQARTIRIQEEAKTRTTEREHNELRNDLGQYRILFQRAYTGSHYFLDWWQAYANDELKDESSVPAYLTILKERSEAGLQRIEETEVALDEYFGTDKFSEKAKLHLNNLKVAQENFGGSETIFTPMVAVHNSIKGADGWVRFQEEFEKFVKDLEDLLDSPMVRTEAANRVRYPDPAKQTRAANLHCPACDKENLPAANFCLSCGASLSSRAGGSGQAPQNLDPASGTMFTLLSIPFAIASLFLFPPLFGGIGIFLGYKAKQAGNEAGGIAMMVVSTACLLFGMLSGFLYWGF